MKEKKCFKCDFTTLTNCEKCTENDGVQQCTACKKGYYMDEDFNCVKCVADCTSCLSENFCTGCQAGFYMETEGGEDTGNCLPCDAEQGCATCQNTATQCTSCLKDYKADGFKCVTKKNIGMKLVFDLDFSDYGKQSKKIMQWLLKTILGDAHVDKLYLVNLKGIRKGSAVIDAEVSLPSDVSPDTALNNAQSDITEGAGPEGIPVVGAPAIVANG